ncbi:MAG: peptidylprolyl isomerase [Eubacteriales bacterium]|nr:peptidylprolyl isomerase [Eubacteriales bacterium]MDD4476149.1 peptidylprolyl isomerase [Eubacteriales bacterium]
MKSKILHIALCLLLVLSISSCTTEDIPEIFNTEGNETSMNDYNTTNPVVALLIKNYGTVVIELYPEIAPNTVNNFIALVKSGFYDNNSFHRSVPGFMIQGGDPNGNGTGGPGYNIKGEFSANGFTNNLKHTEGVISMARRQQNNTAGSQFFLMLGTSNHLDGQYAAFGKIIDGMDIVSSIAKNEKVADVYSGKLVNNVTIEKAVVDTKGIEYPAPEKINN